jgi:hypothetical protein
MITDERRGSLNEDENIDIEETPIDEWNAKLIITNKKSSSPIGPP